MRIILYIMLLITATDISAAGRMRYTINDGWKFHVCSDDTSLFQGTQAWETVNLPHTWNSADADDDVKGYYRGWARYKKNVYIDDDMKENRVTIYFEGVNQETLLYVNGQLTGNHKGGYTGFCFDITEYVKFGSNNELEVKVSNAYDKTIAPLSADFTFFGGIYRDVWLMFLQQTHLSTKDHGSSGISIRTPHENGHFSGVEVNVCLNKHISQNVSIKIENAIVDATGQVVNTKTDVLHLNAKEKETIRKTFIKLDNPHLWDITDPYLYTIRTRIYDNETAVLLDEASTPLGFRWFTFNSEKGFFLNGRHLKLIGTARHQDFLNKGNALSDAMHVRDVELLKEMGGNFLRISHYPQDPTVLEMCDRLGIIASVEIPIVNAVDSSKAFLRNCMEMETEMIRQNRNHPSVIMWGWMNEILLRVPYPAGKERKAYFKTVRQIAENLDNLARKEDPGRYTMMAIHNAPELYEEAGLVDIPMILGLNLYQGWYESDISEFEKILDMMHTSHPKLNIMVTEYGAGIDARLHADKTERFDFTQEYGLFFHKHYYNEIMKRDFVAGASIWNLNDFYSESRIDAVPHVNNKGVTGLDREKKDVYLFYKAVLSNKPVLYIGGRNWKYRACAGNSKEAVMNIPVFSNGKIVELWINGQSVGIQVPKGNVACFSVPLIDGENRLEAKATFQNRIMRDVQVFHLSLIPNDLRNRFPKDGINIMLGSQRYFEDRKEAVCWIPEREYTLNGWGYIGGEPYRRGAKENSLLGTDSDIKGTENDPVFQTQRKGIKAFNADVSDGLYDISLNFAKLTESDPLVYNLQSGIERQIYDEICKFDIYVNGIKIIENLDLTSQYGVVQSIIKKIEVYVCNGQGIKIDFLPKVGMPVLNAIQIFKVN